MLPRQSASQLSPLSRIIAIVETKPLTSKEYDLLRSLKISFIEIRFDTFPSLKEGIKFAEEASHQGFYLLATNRDAYKRESLTASSLPPRFNLLQEIFTLIHVVDIEFEDPLSEDFASFTKECNHKYKREVKTLLSTHNFDTTPNTHTIQNVVNFSQKIQAHYLKLAYLCLGQKDLLRLTKFALEYQNDFIQLQENSSSAHKLNKAELIWIAMGEWGKITRCSSLLYGSPFSYAYMRTTNAPGQLSIFELNELLSNFYPNHI